MKARAAEVWRSSEQLRFLVVGAWNTVFGYLTFLLLYALLGRVAHYLVLAVAAHFIAVTQSYVSQKRLVFAGRPASWAEYLRFNIANLANLLFGLLLLWALADLAGLSVPVAQAIGTALTVVSAYLMHKHYSFRSRE